MAQTFNGIEAYYVSSISETSNFGCHWNSYSNFQIIKIVNISFDNMWAKRDVWFNSSDATNALFQTKHKVKETKVAYIHWPFELKIFAELESLHVIVSHTRVVIWCYEVNGAAGGVKS